MSALQQLPSNANSYWNSHNSKSADRAASVFSPNKDASYSLQRLRGISNGEIAIYLLAEGAVHEGIGANRHRASSGNEHLCYRKVFRFTLDLIAA